MGLKCFLYSSATNFQQKLAVCYQASTEHGSVVLELHISSPWPRKWSVSLSVHKADAQGSVLPRAHPWSEKSRFINNNFNDTGPPHTQGQSDRGKESHPPPSAVWKVGTRQNCKGRDFFGDEFQQKFFIRIFAAKFPFKNTLLAKALQTYKN